MLQSYCVCRIHAGCVLVRPALAFWGVKGNGAPRLVTLINLTNFPLLSRPAPAKGRCFFFWFVLSHPFLFIPSGTRFDTTVWRKEVTERTRHRTYTHRERHLSQYALTWGTGIGTSARTRHVPGNVKVSSCFKAPYFAPERITHRPTRRAQRYHVNIKIYFLRSDGKPSRVVP